MDKEGVMIYGSFGLRTPPYRLLSIKRVGGCLSKLCDPIYVEVRGKKIEINEDVVRILNNYVKMEYSLEKLAQDLGLESWEEAYEFIKAVPAWILWISPTIYSLEKQRCRARGSEAKPQAG